MKICIDPLVDETLNEVREKMHLQLLALIVIFGVFFFFFFGQLFFYQMNQLEVSCMQLLCSIANQEKVNQLIISLVHRFLLMQKTIKEI